MKEVPMGEFIAIAIIILAFLVIVLKVRDARKGKSVTGCCENCNGCDMAQYGVNLNPDARKGDDCGKGDTDV
jgi:hypothetical protein